MALTRFWELVTEICLLMCADLIRYMFNVHYISTESLVSYPLALLLHQLIYYRQYAGLCGVTLYMYIHVQISSEEISSGTTEPHTSLEGRKSASHMASAQATPSNINMEWTARQVVMHTYPVTLGKLLISCNPVWSSWHANISTTWPFSAVRLDNAS